MGERIIIMSAKDRHMNAEKKVIVFLAHSLSCPCSIGIKHVVIDLNPQNMLGQNNSLRKKQNHI